MIKRAFIPAAGLGTRLLSATKEQPKEMLPIFSNDLNGGLSLKPLVQLVFEQLYNFSIRDFCIIVGRGKRAIEYVLEAVNSVSIDSHLKRFDRLHPHPSRSKVIIFASRELTPREAVHPLELIVKGR